MAVKLSPLFNPDSAQIDANGVPRSGGKLFTYSAGTTSKVTTYRDSAGSVAHTNPIVLDANGLPPAPIWLTESSTYKFVLAPSGDTDPPASPILTIDNIVPINDITATAATEWTSGPAPTYISATSFSVTGDATTTLHVGRRLKTTNTGGTRYSTITRSVFGALTTVTVENDSGSLDSGLSALSYGISSADNTSVPFVSRDQQCGRLTRVSATQIRLDPQDGNTIWVNTGSVWKLRTIPSAGVTAANTNIHLDGTGGSNLAANTGYWVYLFDNAGTLTLDFSTTAPAVDTTSGLKIKTGVASRLLVGMAHTNGSSEFDLALSWYQRRGITQSAALSTARSTTSTSYVEVNPEIQVPFLSWAEEAVTAQFTGPMRNNTSAQFCTTRIFIDGVSTSVSDEISAHAGGANHLDNATCAGQKTVSEGYHYMTVGVKVGANTGTWPNGTLYVITQG
jgi:hypothetical protein